MFALVVVLWLFSGNLIGFLYLATFAADSVAKGDVLHAVGCYFAAFAQAIVVAGGFTEAVRRMRGGRP